MAEEICPMPEAAKALSPYIKSREEVAAIRQGLQTYLESQLQPKGGPLSPVTLPLPSAAPLDAPPPALSGVRKAYWKALQAHSAAQAKHDALRAELEQLKYGGRPETGVNGAASSTSIADTYIPLLRQKEKQRKLRAIEKAYSRVDSAGQNLSTNPVDDAVKKQIGELPTPPSTQPASSQNAEGGLLMLDLKKALISTKRDIEERKKQLASYQRDGTSSDAVSISPQAHIAGLQAALQELTGWMEAQLTIIASADTEAPTTDSQTVENDSPPKPSKRTENIEALYEEYLSARKQLISAVKNPPPATPTPTSLSDILGNPSSLANWKDARSPSAATKTSAEILLPHIPTLLASKRQEHALLQQTAFTRRQMSSAETRTEQLIRRLAEESHLVSPGASRGEDWARAARDSAAATQKAIEERVAAGEKCLDSAPRTLRDIQALPGSVDRLIDRP